MKITLKQLEKLNACGDQCILFEELFGKSVTLTDETVKKYAHKFDVAWLTQNFLNWEAGKKFSAERSLYYNEYYVKLYNNPAYYSRYLLNYKKRCAML